MNTEFTELTYVVPHLASVSMCQRRGIARWFNSSPRLTYKVTGAEIVRRQETFPKELAEDIIQCVETGHPHVLFMRDYNGNVMVDMMLTADHEFVALQCLRYQQLAYTPVTEVYTYEGVEARRMIASFIPKKHRRL